MVLLSMAYVFHFQSPLRPIMIEGSSSQLTRGFGQSLDMNAEALSFDPDYPKDKVYSFKYPYSYCIL